MGLSGVLLVGGGMGTLLTGAGPAVAATSDGTLTVEVLRDFFGTGVINATMDVPQRGIQVDVTDPEGNRVTGVTDVTGRVVVPPSGELTGGRYRVDVTVPAPYADYLRAAPASTAENHFDSFTSFVDVSDGQDDSVTTGVWNPADYALPESRYFVPIQSGAGGTDTRALVAFGTDARGTCPDQAACPEVLNTQDQVGTTYGLAYDRYRDQLFQSAFARRYTEYGPEGGGAIYAQPTDGGAPTLFATVPDAVETAHDTDNLIKDAGFTDAPGTESIGGLALSEDGSTLYAVNLLTRSLVSFDATGPTASSPEETVAIPDPGCASAGDWRPFSVAAHDGKLYVGGVCSAESTQDRADLRAVVATYDGEAFTTVLSQPLDFERGNVHVGNSGNGQGNHWNPWHTGLANWDSFQLGGAMINPQPSLASIAFTRDGSLVLGFRDRFMDVVSWGGLDPRPGIDTPQNGMSGGDINMACARPDGGYDWEGTGSCPDHATDPTRTGVQPGSVVEYFPGDFFPNGGSATQPGPHQESALGSVAYIPQQQWVVSTQMDPTGRVVTSGTGYYDVATGLGPGNDPVHNAYEFVGPNQNGFGKAGGLGDIAYAAENAPIQIGNVVWFDGDRNGLQDPGHVLLPGATINLLDADGEQVATTTTDAAGEYYFGGVGAEYELTPGAEYTVQFDVCTADTSEVPGQPAAADLRFTLPRAGDDPVHDSNVTPPTSGRLCDGYAPVTAPATPGGVDHTIDAGVHIPEPEPPVEPTDPPPAEPVDPPAEPVEPEPNAPEPQAPGPDRPGPGPGGSLAQTGTSGLGGMLALTAVLLGAGTAAVLITRQRRARHH
ncbi:SdrD B-like domain-containing protein [Streptomyces sp. DSM 44915]|uniref:SdrD B-like domain-containing protein n=1 Tax=Streptomyces chisholmiae TaxID=3075540 RepID=A0ABU2JVW0_9ACTN|nr:SdrD B-like domain-containing protein [Streptomyces sp. DSM 44915]MDT0269075.1 SdrD B-like domain-containing protein [Streptomyces sp. DSM 44915]